MHKLYCSAWEYWYCTWILHARDTSIRHSCIKVSIEHMCHKTSCQILTESVNSERYLFQLKSRLFGPKSRLSVLSIRIWPLLAKCYSPCISASKINPISEYNPAHTSICALWKSYSCINVVCASPLAWFLHQARICSSLELQILHFCARNACRLASTVSSVAGHDLCHALVMFMRQTQYIRYLIHIYASIHVYNTVSVVVCIVSHGIREPDSNLLTIIFPKSVPFSHRANIWFSSLVWPCLSSSHDSENC